MPAHGDPGLTQRKFFLVLWRYRQLPHRSALANAAALEGKASAYLVWGVENGTHDLVGTTFDPKAAKIGNQELENWLLKLLTPKIDFRFFELDVDGMRVVLLEIGCAFREPVQFQGHEFIRVGSYTKRNSPRCCAALASAKSEGAAWTRWSPRPSSSSSQPRSSR